NGDFRTSCPVHRLGRIGRSRARWVAVPLRLLQIRAISVGNVMMLLAGACLNPTWFFFATSRCG
ncbi:hypothetical protein, partial [Amycolatopsis vastitatis]|uniref:hypothetical protein n=1 Tax=Amycolatopsis vastitatis TaxID=1905142 RepID=UPI00196B9B29